MLNIPLAIVRMVNMNKKHVKTPPRKYAGQWIAWNKDETKIIAHAASFQAISQAIEKRKQPNALLEKVPRFRFSGAR